MLLTPGCKHKILVGKPEVMTWKAYAWVVLLQPCPKKMQCLDMVLQFRVSLGAFFYLRW
jgi:hypothetical protein